MKLGLYSVTYRGVWYRGEAVDLFSLVRLAKQQGWEGLELDAERPHAAPMDLSADDRKRLRDLAGEVGTRVMRGLAELRPLESRARSARSHDLLCAGVHQARA